jgi:hypothetical protein
MKYTHWEIILPICFRLLLFNYKESPVTSGYGVQGMKCVFHFSL